MLARSKRFVAQIAQTPLDFVFLESAILRRIATHEDDAPFGVDPFVVVDTVFVRVDPPAGEHNGRRNLAIGRDHTITRCEPCRFRGTAGHDFAQYRRDDR